MTISKVRLLSGGLLLFASVFAGNALAVSLSPSVPGVLDVSATSTANPSTSYTWGYDFTPTTNIWVTGLGFYDLGQDGLAAEHEIGIWDNSSQDLLGSATVPSGTAADDFLADSRFVNLAEQDYIPLTSGQSYRIGAHIPGGTDGLITQSDAIVTSPLITLGDTHFFASGGSLAYPNVVSSGKEYMAANMLVATPIPPAVLLFGSALGLMGFRMRRGRQS